MGLQVGLDCHLCLVYGGEMGRCLLPPPPSSSPSPSVQLAPMGQASLVAGIFRKVAGEGLGPYNPSRLLA